jgi:hypothetical protein
VHLDELSKTGGSDSPSARTIAIFRAMPPRHRTSKDVPAKLAKRMRETESRRRWRVVLLRSKVGDAG